MLTDWLNEVRLEQGKLKGEVRFVNKNKICQLSNSWYQTSQTGGQWYSDTSPLSIPCLEHAHESAGVLNFYACKGAYTLFIGQRERERDVEYGYFYF